jgi:hypothetical protein
MHRPRHLAATLTFSLLFLALTLVWARSYWRVDKVWAQVLPNHTFKMKIQPGRMTLGCSRSPVTLDVGDGDWFTWPTSVYFAEYIPWPNRPLLGEFHLTNSYLTVPLWLPATLALTLATTFFARSHYVQLRTAAAAPATVPPRPAFLRLGRTWARLTSRRAPTSAATPTV